MFIYSSWNPGKRCSSIKLQLCSQKYHKHVLNFNHVIAPILDLIAAWLQILSRIMSFCQSLRFICTDLMDRLQTSFSLTSMEGNGHPRHPHTMQDNSYTSDSHTAWLYQLQLLWQVPSCARSPFPHKHQKREEWQFCPPISAGKGRHTQKLVQCHSPR